MKLSILIVIVGLILFSLEKVDRNVAGIVFVIGAVALIYTAIIKPALRFIKALRIRFKTLRRRFFESDIEKNKNKTDKKSYPDDVKKSVPYASLKEATWVGELDADGDGNFSVDIELETTSFGQPKEILFIKSYLSYNVNGFIQEPVEEHNTCLIGDSLSISTGYTPPDPEVSIGDEFNALLELELFKVASETSVEFTARKPKVKLSSNGVKLLITKAERDSDGGLEVFYSLEANPETPVALLFVDEPDDVLWARVIEDRFEEDSQFFEAKSDDSIINAKLITFQKVEVVKCEHSGQVIPNSEEDGDERDIFSNLSAVEKGENADSPTSYFNELDKRRDALRKRHGEVKGIRSTALSALEDRRNNFKKRMAARDSSNSENQIQNKKDEQLFSVSGSAGNVVRLTFINTGGEFTGGVIEDHDLLVNIKSKIKGGVVNSYMEFDDGSDFGSWNFTNILHAYAPNVPNANVLIEISSDASNDEYEEFNSISIDESGINQFTCSNPYFDSDSSGKYEDGALVFFSQKIEKRIHYPVVFDNLPEDIDLTDVYVGSINMDETISMDEILHEVLYIPKFKAGIYLREFLQHEPSQNDSLADYMADIYLSDHPLRNTIRSNHLIAPSDIEGKGEWENDYVKILDMSGDVVFEGGAY